MNTPITILPQEYKLTVPAGVPFDHIPEYLPKSLPVTYSNGEKDELPFTMASITPADAADTCTVSGYLSEVCYENPLILHRADPFIHKHTDGFYYFTASQTDAEHNLNGQYQYRRIYLRRASSINGLGDNSGEWEERCVFEKDAIQGTRSPHVWAPEIHFIDGAWYIYFTTTISDRDIWQIRPHVLRCMGDPMKDEWENLGPIRTTVENSRAFTDFSLDHTVLQHKGELYFLWAQKVTRDSDIYIAKMSDPATVCTEMVLLTRPEYGWERHGFAVNEGPSVLVRNGRIFMVFSCSGTDARYCLGMMYADENADLLDPKSWTKLPYPVFTMSRENSQFGPGHNSFTRSEDDRYDIMVYHARQEERYLGEPGYEPLYDAGRNVSALRIHWDPVTGMPDFGVPKPVTTEHENRIPVTVTLRLQ